MHTERLIQLKTHLSQLDNKLWYFGDFVSEVNACGTVGCALGHCPDLWPDDWKICPNRYGNPKLETPYGRDMIQIRDFASKFFGIYFEDVEYIFFDGINDYLEPTIQDVCNRIDRVIGGGR